MIQIGFKYAVARWLLSVWWKAVCLEVFEHAGADCLFVRV